MNESSVKRIEVVAYCATIVLSVIAGTVLIKEYLLPHPPKRTESRITAGTKMLVDYDWGKSNKTLLLVLSETCHFCNESAPFYQKLTSQFSDPEKLRFVAVFPQEVSSATKHLDELGVRVTEIRQAVPSAFGASGTPTLILISNDGTVVDSWVGKLSPEEESRVIEKVRL